MASPVIRQAAATIAPAGRERITFMLAWSSCRATLGPLTRTGVAARYGHMHVNDKPEVTPCNCAAIRQAARRVTRLYDQALSPMGLRITQYPILSWLSAAGPMTVQVLAERLLLDRATLGH